MKVDELENAVKKELNLFNRETNERVQKATRETARRRT